MNAIAASNKMSDSAGLLIGCALMSKLWTKLAAMIVITKKHNSFNVAGAVVSVAPNPAPVTKQCAV